MHIRLLVWFIAISNALVTATSTPLTYAPPPGAAPPLVFSGAGRRTTDIAWGVSVRMLHWVTEFNVVCPAEGAAVLPVRTPRGRRGAAGTERAGPCMATGQCMTTTLAVTI